MAIRFTSVSRFRRNLEADFGLVSWWCFLIEMTRHTRDEAVYRNSSEMKLAGKKLWKPNGRPALVLRSQKVPEIGRGQGSLHSFQTRFASSCQVADANVRSARAAVQPGVCVEAGRDPLKRGPCSALGSIRAAGTWQQSQAMPIRCCWHQSLDSRLSAWLDSVMHNCCCYSLVTSTVLIPFDP